MGVTLLKQVALSPSVLSTVVVQPYDIDIGKEFVIVGNDAIVKCQVPSFVADWVSIIGWTASDDELKSMTQENSQGNQLEGSQETDLLSNKISIKVQQKD